MNARHCVLKILEEFERRSGGLDSIVEQTFANHRIDRRDKRLIQEIVYGVLRNRMLIEYILQEYLDDKMFLDNKHLMRLLETGAYQILFLDRIPPHAAVNESVRLAKRDERTKNFSGVVNAVLRKLITNKRQLPKPHNSDTMINRLAITYSHPHWFVEKWLRNFGLSNTKKLLEFNNTRPQIYLRRKIKGLSRQQFEYELKCISNKASTGSGYLNLYYTLNKPVIPGEIRVFNEGHCTVQAESSGWVVAMLDIQKGDSVLDVCSAPGGKTSLMAELIGKNGAVCATELHFPRLKIARGNLKRMNLTENAFFIVCNGTSLPFNGYFDKILLDAPCSGTGVMHRHPDARWTRTQRDLDHIVQVQEKLLDKVAPFVVPNGILVYATCSLEPEENHEQVKRFLDRHKEFTLEKPYSIIKQAYVDNDGYLFITPFEHKMDGMFAARLRRCP